MQSTSLLQVWTESGLMDLKTSARVDVKQALINAKEIDQKQVIDFVEDRLIFFHVEGQKKN